MCPYAKHVPRNARDDRAERPGPRRSPCGVSFLVPMMILGGPLDNDRDLDAPVRVAAQAGMLAWIWWATNRARKHQAA